MRLIGKTALITGASRNIGRAVAIAFAREGAELVLSARDSTAELRAVAAECEFAGARVVPILSDVSDAGDAHRLVNEASDALGRIDVLVSTVAIRPHTPFVDLTIDEWRRVMATNLDATFHLCKAVVPGMVQRKSGSLIAFGGLVSLTGVPETAATSASKTGLLGLIRALAAELGPHGVRANMVIPGNVDTVRVNPEWYQRLGEPTASAANLSRIPLRRLGSVQEIAAVCVFLASDEASYVTGNQVVCNGGSFIP